MKKDGFVSVVAYPSMGDGRKFLICVIARDKPTFASERVLSS